MLERYLTLHILYGAARISILTTSYSTSQVGSLILLICLLLITLIVTLLTPL
uniref:Phospholamban n=1 Tax=CrAss-like virus sp. ctXt06 TaxID=2825837 RepID=A0A8S5V6Z2_9CAUD|nr:MAG TPA: Phospholamban [CrAss-like virus sp. ctXt06]